MRHLNLNRNKNNSNMLVRNTLTPSQGRLVTHKSSERGNNEMTNVFSDDKVKTEKMEKTTSPKSQTSGVKTFNNERQMVNRQKTTPIKRISCDGTTIKISHAIESKKQEELKVESARELLIDVDQSPILYKESQDETKNMSKRVILTLSQDKSIPKDSTNPRIDQNLKQLSLSEVEGSLSENS